MATAPPRASESLTLPAGTRFGAFEILGSLVRVDAAAREPFQEPVPIFKARVRFIPLDSRGYDMSPDGQRFIVAGSEVARVRTTDQ